MLRHPRCGAFKDPTAVLVGDELFQKHGPEARRRRRRHRGAALLAPGQQEVFADGADLEFDPSARHRERAVLGRVGGELV